MRRNSRGGQPGPYSAPPPIRRDEASGAFVGSSVDAGEPQREQSSGRFAPPAVTEARVAEAGVADWPPIGLPAEPASMPSFTRTTGGTITTFLPKEPPGSTPQPTAVTAPALDDQQDSDSDSDSDAELDALLADFSAAVSPFLPTEELSDTSSAEAEQAEQPLRETSADRRLRPQRSTPAIPMMAGRPGADVEFEPPDDLDQPVAGMLSAWVRFFAILLAVGFAAGLIGYALMS